MSYTVWYVVVRQTGQFNRYTKISILQKTEAGYVLTPCLETFDEATFDETTFDGTTSDETTFDEIIFDTPFCGAFCTTAVLLFMVFRASELCGPVAQGKGRWNQEKLLTVAETVFLKLFRAPFDAVAITFLPFREDIDAVATFPTDVDAL